MYFKFYFIRYFFLVFSIVFLVLVLFNIISPNEAFAMEPDTDVIRSFNPDSYISHELDGKPITKQKCLYQGKSRFTVDYYGHKEYQGRDAYGYYHQPQNAYGYYHEPQNLDKATQVEPLSSTKTAYDNRYNTCNNPDYQVSDNRTNFNHQGYKSGEDLHLSKGKNVGSFLVSGEQSKFYELDAGLYEGTISTDVDSVT
jgi:hypothetical protein